MPNPKKTRSEELISNLPKMTPAEKLISDLHRAFEYTNDNNRDLLQDTTFPMWETVDELNLQWAWQYLVAYISREAEMINSNMSDD